jgi:hypothetical protein
MLPAKELIVKEPITIALTVKESIALVPTRIEHHNFCFYFQNRLIQTSQTGVQWYSDTSPLVFLGTGLVYFIAGEVTQPHISIVSNLISEMMCLQMFIVKTLIIINMNSHHIYMKQKEGAREHNRGETEIERVRESGRIVAKLR